MLRKIIVASTLGLFLATSVVTPASAAKIKTGTSCKKAGQSVKVGKKTYVCGKNPIVTPTKNTYMLKACRDANQALGMPDAALQTRITAALARLLVPQVDTKIKIDKNDKIKMIDDKNDRLFNIKMTIPLDF